ncbi:MAG TPA: hypothetical protein DEG69_09105 [Flavobacteriaceae bacterium]|jgi:vacuolar-type H+-ATPase catalytic subunit A/Vma1|nr:hypothetical protein [Flavobacteriaceae bacterium]|tara:strand:+ start:40788 stop:41264 length:477 start_codon:yes stop_codon:yes gene_type:complete
MKPATVAQLKKELKFRSSDELEELCLRLAKFKKENKELLTYLLFQSHNEEAYIKSVKQVIDDGFSTINTNSYYYMKKTVRKVLRMVKKYIRYSKKKETEVELLLYFCEQLKNLRPSIKKNKMLTNLYERQLILAKKRITELHEDLQHDYTLEIEELNL